MKGRCVPAGTSKYSCTSSRVTVGANGRKYSRYLILPLITFFISALVASARIDREPSARGPNSMRPWNQPTT